MLALKIMVSLGRQPLVVLADRLGSRILEFTPVLTPVGTQNPTPTGGAKGTRLVICGRVQQAGPTADLGLHTPDWDLVLLAALVDKRVATNYGARLSQNFRPFV